MNFADFSFWWTLLTAGLVLLVIRGVGSYFKVWSASLDRLGLMALSLVIFWAASRTSFVIFVLELAFNYTMVRLMQRQRGQRAIALATVTITIDLLILAYFKYLEFFVQGVLGLDPDVAQALRAPLPYNQFIPPGISFYTFQMVAFVVDSLRSPDQRPLTLVDYVNFTAFFPQVVAGPIERRSHLLPQMQAFQFQLSARNLELGLRWVVLGLFMKLVLADNLSALINLNQTQNAWLIWLSVWWFGWRIYFDFAGYSFVALGLARILGVELTQNFVAPYLARNVQEFWRRWHVTLSTWFRDYLYLPLGGSRVRWVALNVLIVFGVSGLWHGAGWNFIVWGLYHGLLLVIYRYGGRSLALPTGLSWLLTYGAVMLGWLFFMEPNGDRLLTKVQTLLTPAAYTWPTLAWERPSVALLQGCLLSGLCVAFLIIEFLAEQRQRDSSYALLLSPYAARALLVLTVLLPSDRPSEFIYFFF